MAEAIELRRYEAADGGVPYDQWLGALDERTAGRIASYVGRMGLGNFGDSKPVGGGVSELRIHFGPGYRVYYLRDGQALVLLLCGGDKSSQAADIRRARSYADEYRGVL